MHFGEQGDVKAGDPDPCLARTANIPPANISYTFLSSSQSPQCSLRARSYPTFQHQRSCNAAPK